MSRLVLIDGSSYLFRAFHALPPLTAPDGSPTGALYGIVNMLRTTLKENPDYTAFVLDASGPTFRDALYPQYKANRPPMPDDLRAQVEPMKRIVEALGFPLLCVPGVEADDVIGTRGAAGARGRHPGHHFHQRQGLRPAGAARHHPHQHHVSGSVLDDAGVVEKFGVRADQIVDLLALMGDTVDNVPGVDKCGPKTAAKWLGEYGTLEAVVANAAKIGGKIGENLRAALDRLPLNQQLVTIKTDVALDRAPADLTLRPRDVEALRELYTRCGFGSALRELDGTAAPAARGARPVSAPAPVEEAPDPALSAPGHYECILDFDALRAWIARLQAADLVSFDTETDSLDPMRANLVGLSFCVEPGQACYIPVGHDYPGAPAQLDRAAVLDALRPVLEDAAKPKLGQHGKYDLHVLRRHGVTVRGYAEDTMLESFVFNAGGQRHDMDTLAQKYLGYTTIKYEQVAGKGAKQILFSQVALDDATQYAAEDADVTLRLHRVLSARLAAEPTLQAVYRDIEMPLVSVLTGMEATGVLIDAAELRRQSADLSQRMLAAQQRAHDARRPRPSTSIHPSSWASCCSRSSSCRRW